MRQSRWNPIFNRLQNFAVTGLNSVLKYQSVPLKETITDADVLRRRALIDCSQKRQKTQIISNILMPTYFITCYNADVMGAPNEIFPQYKYVKLAKRQEKLELQK